MQSSVEFRISEALKNQLVNILPKQSSDPTKRTFVRIAKRLDEIVQDPTPQERSAFVEQAAFTINTAVSFFQPAPEAPKAEQLLYLPFITRYFTELMPNHSDNEREAIIHRLLDEEEKLRKNDEANRIKYKCMLVAEGLLLPAAFGGLIYAHVCIFNILNQPEWMPGYWHHGHFHEGYMSTYGAVSGAVVGEVFFILASLALTIAAIALVVSTIYNLQECKPLTAVETKAIAEFRQQHPRPSESEVDGATTTFKR